MLEACCGTGALACKIAMAVRLVNGVDLSPRNIAFAKERGRNLAPSKYQTT